MISSDGKSLAAIALSAALVYAIRFLGLVLGNRLPKTGSFKRGMDALPGTIFAALVFPGLAEAGLPGWAAAAVIFLVVRKTGNVLLAMLLGVGAVAMLRAGLRS